MKNIRGLLEECTDILEARSTEYNGNGDMFKEIANEFNRNRESDFSLSAGDVLDVLVSLKVVRLRNNPEHHDSLVDLVNYSILRALNKAGKL